MKDTVYIYATESASSSVLAMMLKNFGLSFSKNGLKVKPIFGAEIVKGNWIDNAYALILGGAESTIFRKALSPDGSFRKDDIQAAHRAGVHFAAYCGGAFLSHESIVFKGEGNYFRQGEGLGLYPRKSFGAASGFTPKDFTGMSDSAAIISLRHQSTGKYFHSLYCCGPDFPVEGLPDNARPLATAVNPITGKEHVMAVQIPATDGLGSISLYGHHPEYLSEFINFRTREVPSIPHEDERLRAEARRDQYGILLGFNLMLYDLKTAMGLSYEPQRLIVPQLTNS